MEGVSFVVNTQRGAFHCRRYGATDDVWFRDVKEQQHQHQARTPAASSSSSSTTTAPTNAAVDPLHIHPPPLMVCVHGAGMSSMSFAACGAMIGAAETIDDHTFACRVVSLDLRSHGASADGEGGEASLTLDALVLDVVEVVQALHREHFPATQRFYYAGHSLGGAVVAHAATNAAIASLLGGVVMLDIVEEVAKISLKHMHAVLDKRPVSFATTREAAHWFVTQGGMFNEAMAQQTVPFLLRPCTDGTGRYEWRTDLRRTESCWSTWFEGLDKKFIGLPCPKMLLLATTDRLDKELTTAHMQGKFQLEVVGTQGHYVMEDEPSTVATKLMRFVNHVETLSRRLPQLNKSTMRSTATC